MYEEQESYFRALISDSFRELKQGKEIYLFSNEQLKELRRHIKNFNERNSLNIEIAKVQRKDGIIYVSPKHKGSLEPKKKKCKC